jgi:hypothetical protein
LEHLIATVLIGIADGESTADRADLGDIIRGESDFKHNNSLFEKHANCNTHGDTTKIGHQIVKMFNQRELTNHFLPLFVQPMDEL